LLAGLCLFLFFWRLGATPLFGQDEALYSECAREMAFGGSHIVPTCNGAPFFDKPPLVYWLQGAAMHGFGVNSFSVRLPSALAAFALVLLTVCIGSRLYSRRVGILAGFVLASSALTAALARMAILDATFALTISLSLGAFILSYLGKLPRCGYLIFWAAMGFSALVKGPAGIVLILGTVGIFLVIRRKPGELMRTMPAPGLLIFLAIALPWYILVHQQTHGAFTREFFIHQNLQRAAGEDFHHNSPFFMSLVFFMAGMFPWSVFFPPAWFRFVRQKPASPEEEASLFAAVWAAVVVVIFSISRSKLPGYVYPAFPAGALLIGQLWARAFSKGSESREKLPELRSLKRGAVAALVVGGLLGAAIPFGERFLHDSMPGLSWALVPMGVSLFIGSVLTFALLYIGKPRSAFAALCSGIAGFMAAAVCIGLPIANRPTSEPAVKMARYIASTAPARSPVYSLKIPAAIPPLIAFYSGRPAPMKDPAALRITSGCYLLTCSDSHIPSPKGAQLEKRFGKYELSRVR